MVPRGSFCLFNFTSCGAVRDSFFPVGVFCFYFVSFQGRRVSSLPYPGSFYDIRLADFDFAILNFPDRDWFRRTLEGEFPLEQPGILLKISARVVVCVLLLFPFYCRRRYPLES